MSDPGKSPRDDASHNMAATIVGKFPFAPPPAKPAANPPPQSAPAASTPAPPPAQRHAPAPPPSSVALPPSLGAPQSRSSTVLLLVIGFIAVLLIGALLIFLFLYNIQS
jgi:hypothetical protein